MKTIHKFMFSITDAVTLEMPKGAIIRHVGFQGVVKTRLCVWAEVDPDQPLERRVIYVRGTGHPLPEGRLAFLGSVIADPFVWHVYEPVRPVMRGAAVEATARVENDSW